MSDIRLLESERVKRKLTKAQEREIRSLYSASLKRVRNWSESLKGRDNISSTLRRQYLSKMEEELMEEMENIGVEIEGIVKKNISSTATAVVTDANRVLKSIGLDLHTAFSFVPADVVQAISTGQIYAGDWTLSKAVWKGTKKSQQDIHSIIAQGVLENKGSYEIAKDLEKYVDPKAKKPWNWNKLYPGTAKKVDYNAQRLARTLVSHAYQQSFVRTTKSNPFFQGYRWLTANNHRVCPLCEGYAHDVHADGLPEGVFLKDDLPLDHPNGQCTMAIYTEYSTEMMTTELAEWAHGGSNSGLDKFAKSLGYSISDLKKMVK